MSVPYLSRHCFCAGDILGRALKNLDGLLKMPYGCGEQNMALLAPNIYILQYLKNTQQLTPAIVQKATNFLTSGESVRLCRAMCRCQVWQRVCVSLSPDTPVFLLFRRLPETAELQRQRRCLQHIWIRSGEHLVRTVVPINDLDRILLWRLTLRSSRWVAPWHAVCIKKKHHLFALTAAKRWCDCTLEDTAAKTLHTMEKKQSCLPVLLIKGTASDLNPIHFL